MSPVHERWFDVPNQESERIRDKIKDYIAEFGFNLPDLIKDGFAFLYEDGQVRKLVGYASLSKGILENSRRENGAWHLVNPMDNSSRRRLGLDKFWGEVSTEDAKPKSGHHHTIRGSRKSPHI